MKRFVIFTILVTFYRPSLGQQSFDFGHEIIPIHVLDNTPLAIIYELEGQLGYKFSYDADQLKKSAVSIVSDSLTLLEIVDSLFLIHQPELRIVGYQIVVYKPSVIELSSSCFKTVEGQLIDELTRLPVANASVNELRSEQMTVSNTDGRFRLTVPCEEGTAQIVIRAMGYHSQLIERPLDAKFPQVEMRGDYITLQEVVIRSIPAEILIKEVLDQIPNNFMDQSTNATAFFRDAVLKNGKLIKMSEAVLEVYNQSYLEDGQKDQAKLIKGRKYLAPRPKDTLEFKIKGSLQSCFELDVVKNQPSFFNKEGYKSYEYFFEDVVVFNGREIYVIGFNRKSLAGGLPYEGQMFIDKERLALVSIDFELKKASMRGTRENFVIKKSRGTRTSLQSAHYQVNYEEAKEKLVMNYARLETNFKVKKKKSLFSVNYSTLSEYVVNQFSIEKVKKIKSKETFFANRVFMDEPLEYDEEYWHGINFLPIDKALNEATEELRKILQSPRK